ncbi:MAG: hypothetical protein ACK56F_10360, partial [bacterium]
MLHRDGETLADGVPCEGALALREHAGGRLIRHAGSDALVERVHIPLDLAVRLVHVHVRQNGLGERRGRGVRYQAVSAVGEERVAAFESVWQVPALVALVPLLV